MIVAENCGQHLGMEVLHGQLMRLTAKQRLLTVTEKLIHQGMDRAADQQIDMTSVLLEVPDAPHVRKDALIDTEKVLKLIDDKREGALMGKAHEIIEDVSKLRSCA